MAGYDYDLFVIGAGSGGVRAGRLAAASGALVAVAEEYRVGGTCVIRGCVPKKFMVYASEFSSAFKAAKGFGWTIGETSFDWETFLEAKDIEIARLSGIYVTNLENAGADIILSRAELKDAHTVWLPAENRTVTADKILIATGGRPTVPPDLPGVELAITSNEAFHLPELPKRILVVGGGYIAVEFAGIFNGLGVETTLLYRGPNILRGFDNDVRTHLTGELEKRGIKVILSCQHTSLEKSPTGIVSQLSSGHAHETDVVMFATGREPYTQGLGLEAAGVALNPRGAVIVDNFSRTSVENIWAVGDVTDRINLTPVAIREGAAFAENRVPRQSHELRPRHRRQRGVFPAAGGIRRPLRSRRAPCRSQGRGVPLRVPPDEDHLLWRRGTHADEAGRRRRNPPRDRLPHRRPRLPGNDPDGRHRHQARRHQTAMGPDLRRPPDRRRGTGDHARAVCRAGNDHGGVSLHSL